MRPALFARPEQPLTPRQIHLINLAFRDAALADDANDALDIVADALRALTCAADIRRTIRAEVQHV